MTQTAVDTEVIKAAVQLACRAPSLHNSQPWRWVGDRFHRRPVRRPAPGRDVHRPFGPAVDHQLRGGARSLPGRDGGDRLGHPRRRVPQPEQPRPPRVDRVLPVRFGADEVTEARRDRAAAISRRRTDRRPFRAPKDWASFEPVLRSCFDGALATLDVVADEARPRLAEASHLTEALRRYDDLYQHELRWWTAPSRGDRRDTAGRPADRSAGRRGRGEPPFPRRRPDRGGGPPAADDAKIVVLSTTGETRADALDCGQALSAVLLECTIAGLATCAVTHLTELEAGRDVVRGLLPDAASMPQVLIRVGAGTGGQGPRGADTAPAAGARSWRSGGRRDQPG